MQIFVCNSLSFLRASDVFLFEVSRGQDKVIVLFSFPATILLPFRHEILSTGGLPCICWGGVLSNPDCSANEKISRKILCSVQVATE